MIFSALLLIVQRAERKRRTVTAIIMLIVGLTVRNYAVYAMGRGCVAGWQPLCSTLVIQQQSSATAIATINFALISMVIVNVLYWALFGRYNPVGSSDAITVIGRYD